MGVFEVFESKERMLLGSRRREPEAGRWRGSARILIILAFESRRGVVVKKRFDEHNGCSMLSLRSYVTDCRFVVT